MNQKNICFYEFGDRWENSLKGEENQDVAIELDNKMVDQAIILLSDGGIGSVTLEAVCVNSGYSMGLVLQHCGTEIGLLIRVLNSLEIWLGEKCRLATEGKYGLEAINSLFLDAANDINKNKDKYRAYLGLKFYGLESNQELSQCLIESKKIREKELIKRLREALVLEQLSRNVDIEMLADFIMAAMIGLVHKWMADPGFDIELRLNQFVKIHLKALFTHAHLYYSVKYWGE